MTQAIDAPFARRFLQRLQGAANAHCPQAVAALRCDDLIWEDPAAPPPATASTSCFWSVSRRSPASVLP